MCLNRTRHKALAHRCRRHSATRRTAQVRTSRPRSCRRPTLPLARLGRVARRGRRTPCWPTSSSLYSSVSAFTLQCFLCFHPVLGYACLTATLTPLLTISQLVGQPRRRPPRPSAPALGRARQRQVRRCHRAHWPRQEAVVRVQVWDSGSGSGLARRDLVARGRCRVMAAGERRGEDARVAEGSGRLCFRLFSLQDREVDRGRVRGEMSARETC